MKRIIKNIKLNNNTSLTPYIYKIKIYRNEKKYKIYIKNIKDIKKNCISLKKYYYSLDGKNNKQKLIFLNKLLTFITKLFGLSIKIKYKNISSLIIYKDEVMIFNKSNDFRCVVTKPYNKIINDIKKMIYSNDMFDIYYLFGKNILEILLLEINRLKII